MNKNLHKIVFSKVRNAYVVVSEIASSVSSGNGRTRNVSVRSASGFGASACVVASGLTLSFMLMASAWAAPAVPKGGVVAQGNVAISQNGNVMTVNQSSDKAIVNWQSFSIGTGAAVNIVQPSASSTHLSRVTGNDPSVIQGQLQSNGQVVLVNPNGIVVGKDGSVSANSFTASTLNITDADFMAGKYQYARNGANGEVINQGKIETAAGGYVALLGAKVTNEGTITSQQGAVYLGAGDAVAVPVTGSGRIKFEVSPAAINTSVNNNKDAVIVAEGGQVYMRAASLNDLAVASVQQTGSIDVSGAKSGNVTVLADKGQIKATGTIKANSTGTTNGVPNKGGNVIIGRDLETGVLAASTDVSGAKLQAKDGFVETSADYLETAGIQVQAKTWLLDPVNVEINASGTGSTGGTSYIAAGTIGSALELGTDVVINTGFIPGSTSTATGITHTGTTLQGNGDILVNASIVKNVSGTDPHASLTLQAFRNITVSTNTVIESKSGKLDVIFNSNSTGAGGNIVLSPGSKIISNGGNITLGGGTGLVGNGFALSDGISGLQGIALYTATIDAGGGDIAMRGQSASSVYQGNLPDIAGILIAGGTISTSGSGKIYLEGKNQIGNLGTGNGFIQKSGTISGGSTASPLVGSTPGSVTIIGDSRDSSTGYSNINGAVINGTVTSTGGNINIEGYGGKGVQYNKGVMIGGTVAATGSGTITIVGTATATGGEGGNEGFTTSAGSKISSVDGNISITGTGGLGTGSVMRNYGVVTRGTGDIAIESTGTGSIKITGTGINVDNGYTEGVLINTGGVKTNSGDIEVIGAVAKPYQKAVNIKAKIDAGGSGRVYIHSAGANITNTGTISAHNIYIDNSGALDPTTGPIIPGTAGASTWSGVISQNGVDINGSLTARNNVYVYGNQTGSSSGVSVNGAGTTVSGKNIYLDGKSQSGNGVTLTASTITASNIQSTGTAITGANGFAWNGGNIVATGTGGDSAASRIEGISKASTTASNGYGAFMIYDITSAVTAEVGKTIALVGNATTAVNGQNTKQRGILVQGGRTLTTSGDVTLEGNSRSSDGISIGGNIIIAGDSSKLTLKGTTDAVTSANLNGVNLSGSITNSSTATNVGPVTITGNATLPNSSSPDVGVSISGTINTQGDIVVDGQTAAVPTTLNAGVNITNTASLVSTGSAKTVSLTSNGNVVNAGAIKVTGASGTGSSINLTSTSATGAIRGTGAIGDTTNKNSNVTFKQSGTSTYSGAINARDLTKKGTGSLTLDSWLLAAPLLPTLTNVSNAYTVQDGGALYLSTNVSPRPAGTAIVDFPNISPVSVNVVNNSTFGTLNASNGRWNNTTFNFTGGLGGGTLQLGGNPIGWSGTTNTFTTSGGKTNEIIGVFNANNANINLNVQAATSGTGLLGGGFAAINFSNSPQGGYGIGSVGAGAATVSMFGGGNVLFKDTLKATTVNINAGRLHMGDGSAAVTIATANLDATNVNIATGASLVFNRAEVYSNASKINGTGNLVQAGAGTLTLTGDSNLFAGATTVNAGRTLAIGSSGTTAGSLGAAGSTLFLADSAAKLQFTNSTGTSVVGSTISGAGSLTSNGLGGTGVLTANNAYSGETKIEAGTLQVGNGGAVGSLGSYAGAITNNGTLAYNLSRDITVANEIKGSGALSQRGSGTTTLTANNTYTGATDISAGTLQVGNGGAVGSLGSNAGPISNNGTLAYNLSRNITVANEITGSGALSQRGSGTTTLTANNTYTGETTISGGVLQVGNGGGTGSLGIGGDVKLTNNASLNYQRNTSTVIDNKISGTGNVSALLTGATSVLTVNKTIDLTGGTINLVTDGDLLLKNEISTTNATNAAITLNAGKSANAGTASAGNVIVSGSGAITLSSSTARATLYTGSVSGSTGVNSLVGNGSGKFRYGSDEMTTNYSASLGQGVHAIYREAPVLDLQLINATKTYDAETWSGPNSFTVNSGIANGDSISQQGLVSYSGDALNAVNVGTYAINATALSQNALGYAISTINPATLKINQASLIVTGANTSVNYDGQTQVNSGANVTGAKGTDRFSVSGYASGINPGTTRDNLSVAAIGSTLLSNYDIQYINGAMQIVAVNPPTPTPPTPPTPTPPTPTPPTPTPPTPTPAPPTPTPTTAPTDNASSTRSSPAFTGTASAQTSTAAARNAVVVGGGAQGGEFQLASAQECATEACVCEVSDFDKSVELCYEEDIPSARSRVSSR